MEILKEGVFLPLITYLNEEKDWSVEEENLRDDVFSQKQTYGILTPTAERVQWFYVVRLLSEVQRSIEAFSLET